MPQNMFVIELGHEGVNRYQNPPLAFVDSPSRAGPNRRGGTTPSGSNLVSHLPLVKKGPFYHLFTPFYPPFYPDTVYPLQQGKNGR